MTRQAVLISLLATACASAPGAKPQPAVLPPLPAAPAAAAEAPVVLPGEPMPSVPVQPACEGWSLWESYAARFVDADGRVIDRTAGDRSTSEGQSYGLFFALVANDRPRFEKILAWTERNLAKGGLSRSLPAWLWGRADDGSWRVLDRNAASDADLWIAYSLLEASRLWNEPGYEERARDLLALVARREVAKLPGLGPIVLPGPVGFELEKGRAWRLNASYLPPQLLRRFAAARMPGPWTEILASTERLLREGGAHGRLGDWTIYAGDRGFAVDREKGAVSSYDAIRVYLWAGMLDPDDPLRPALEQAAGGLFVHALRYGYVPERMEVVNDLPGQSGAPPGFAAALLPEAIARGDMDLAGRLEAELARSWNGALYGDPPAYYDQNLILFARGFVEGRYGFEPDGRLGVRWEGRCTR